MYEQADRLRKLHIDWRVETKFAARLQNGLMRSHLVEVHPHATAFQKRFEYLQFAINAAYIRKGAYILVVSKLKRMST